MSSKRWLQSGNAFALAALARAPPWIKSASAQIRAEMKLARREASGQRVTVVAMIVTSRW